MSINKEPTIKPQTITGIFTRYIAKTIPLAFDESMSYYECICALLEYINKTVMPDLNNVNEGLEELQSFYLQLQDYVNSYFDNLDVQEEINNKLDEMVEDGALEQIIEQYLSSSALWGFDNVSEMKLATNLINGSYAKTLGYHDKNDGGSALYKVRTITNDDVVDEMFIVALNDNTLIAELITDDKVNVKQLGAYGDDTNDDTNVIDSAATYCLANNKILYIPKGTYSVTSLDLKSLTIICEGYINNENTLVLGAVSQGTTTTNVEIYKCNDVQIEGAKNSLFNILYSDTITLYANGSTANIASMAYCKINGITTNGITINCINNGWVNENEFNIKRCEGDLIITGDGSYSPNNNHFNNICIEGNTKHITINYGHNNYITYRGEQDPVITLGTNPIMTFGNIIQRQLIDHPGNMINFNDFNKNTTININSKEYIPTFKTVRLFEINNHTAKNMNGSIWVTPNGEIHPQWSEEFESEKLDASFPFTIYLNADKNSQRVYFTCYDDSDNKIPGNVYISGITYDETNHDYRTTSNVSNFSVNFVPSSEVKYVTIKVTGGNTTFNYMTLDMVMPFTNSKTFVNKIITNKKFLSSSPVNFTNNNPTWVVGDFVYSSNPGSSNVLGWVCTVAGTGASSTWRAVPLA